jgi:predicted glutamine amidotransferase
MCRWLAYMGPPLLMEELLFRPDNSLIRQSLSARRSIVPTNGDGFGLGWFGNEAEPGLFRDTLPAWNDANLRCLSQQIRSRLFFAHVRASTGTSTSRENCHPFRCNGTLFMHNGKIGGYLAIRRRIESMIPHEHYANRMGTTDSEAFYLLALGNGLLDDPVGALERTVGDVTAVMRDAGIDDPFRMTAAFTDGRGLVALRYSNDERSPTLYHAQGGGIGIEGGTVRIHPGEGTTVVLSEPLDEDGISWKEIPEAHVLRVADGAVSVLPFRPAAAH